MLEHLIEEQQSISFILLLLMSFVLPITAARRVAEPAVQLAWTGQLLVAFSGLAMLLMPQYSFLALAAGFVVCSLFVYRIQRIKPERVIIVR